MSCVRCIYLTSSQPLRRAVPTAPIDPELLLRHNACYCSCWDVRSSRTTVWAAKVRVSALMLLIAVLMVAVQFA